MDNIGSYLEGYEECHIEGRCSHYIGNSMGWDRGGLTEDVFRSMNEDHGTVGVLASGNINKPVAETEIRLAREGRLIVVGSVDPLGRPSDFSNYSSDLTISVPSDEFIRSYDFLGRPATFGGTSASQPLTTASLLAFTKITAYPLSSQQATALLKKTALHFPSMPSLNSMGAGMLNAYKIGEIAFRLKRACQNFKAKARYDLCISNALKYDVTYQFDLTRERSKVMSDAQRAFPNCFSKESSQESTCEEKIESLKRLRQLAFLDSSDQEAWEIISCIHRQNGLTTQAEFYYEMAQRLNKSDKDVLEELFRDKKYDQLLKAIHPENIGQVLSLINLNDPDVDSELLEFAAKASIQGLVYGHDVKDMLREVLNHRNVDLETSNAVGIAIVDYFSHIEDPIELFNFIINDTKIKIPMFAIYGNADRLLSDPSLWQNLMRSERLEGNSLHSIADYLVSNYESIPNFEAKLNELLNHDKANGYDFNGKDIKSKIVESSAGAIFENYSDVTHRVFERLMDNYVEGRNLKSMTYDLLRRRYIYQDDLPVESILQSLVYHPKADQRAIDDILDEITTILVDERRRERWEITPEMEQELRQLETIARERQSQF